ncbi:hypothetical protein ACIBO1_23245 [Micromonospora sp. NPDC049903]|uniref:hypothetical protein n=1 Tax=Micromonospora sp. NPDC049903 TaxID=3364276 RepID=UPI0037926F13
MWVAVAGALACAAVFATVTLTLTGPMSLPDGTQALAAPADATASASAVPRTEVGPPTPSVPGGAPASAPPTDAEEADPNEFLGTVASVAGTVAAILGGFVLAALLNLSSARNSMSELLRERKRSTAALRNRWHEQNRQNDAALRDLLLSWLRLCYEDDDEAPPPADVRHRLHGLRVGQPAEYLHEIALTFVENRRAADALVADTIPDLDRNADLRSFARWAVRHPHDDVDVDLVRDAFERAIESIRRRGNLTSPKSVSSGSPQQQEEAKRRGGALAALEIGLRGFRSGPMAATAAGLRDDLDRSEEALRELHDELTAFRLPSHLGAGVALFCFIVVIGVCYPLYLMPTTPADFTPTAEVLVKAGIVAQLVAITLYMWVLIRSVRGAAPEPDASAGQRATDTLTSPPADEIPRVGETTG